MVDIIYSDFLSYADKAQVAEVTIQGDNISGRLTNGMTFKTYAPKDAGAITLLKERGVRISAKPVEDSPWFMTILKRMYHLFNQPKTARTEIIYSEFLNYVDKTQVTEVTIQGDNISGRLTNGTTFKTYAPKDAGAITLLKERRVRISAKPVDDSP
jgi:ATP-dependent Zn protease